MVKAASRRLKPWEERVSVHVGSAVDTGLPDSSIDIAIELQVLHHVINWQAAVAELARVLRPGGSLLFEDSTQEELNGHWWPRLVLSHPTDNRFSEEQFVAQLALSGFVVDEIEDIDPRRWFVGVAHRRFDTAAPR
jgi:ubiquinone/menaquinone biosynthesis C-methylase UbiE